MNVFNCNQCPETFTRKWNLEVHQKRKHQTSSSKENIGFGNYKNIQTQTYPQQLLSSFMHKPPTCTQTEPNSLQLGANDNCQLLSIEMLEFRLSPNKRR